jgi:thiamine-monophosphate kinase
MAKRSKSGAIAERERIRRLTALTSGKRFPHLTLGIGDDAAILRPPRGQEIVVTTDLSLEGVHFRRDWHPAASAGHRCLARGLSDLAAMGAEPLAAFLSLALPTALAGKWTDGFFSGLQALADEYNIPLAGGDLGRSPSPKHALADITLIGSLPRGQALLRSTAQAGDTLYVTGQLGAAAAELESLGSKRKRRTAIAQPIRNSGSHPHLYPQPRVAAGIALRRLARRYRQKIACLDISDGLALDLSRLLEASSVKKHLTAELDFAALPIASGATLAQALHGGEDYELLFAASASLHIPVQLAGISVTAIGRVVQRKARQPELTLIHPNGRRESLEPRGWQYFS